MFVSFLIGKREGGEVVHVALLGGHGAGDSHGEDAYHLGRRQHSWELTGLYALLGGLWLLGTLALFCDGPMRWITPRQLL